MIVPNTLTFISPSMQGFKTISFPESVILLYELKFKLYNTIKMAKDRKMEICFIFYRSGQFYNLLEAYFYAQKLMAKILSGLKNVYSLKRQYFNIDI